MTESPPIHRSVWRLYEHLAMVIGLGTLAILCLTWLPFAAVLHPCCHGHWDSAWDAA